MDLKAEIRRHNPFFLNQEIQFLTVEELCSVEPFIFETIWEDNGSINVFLVQGTKHPDYQGMTWLEFLEKGKRMKSNLELFEANPDYYLNTEHKLPTMSYLQIDGGPLYIDDDGEHRTCIAKMFFFLKGLTMLHGVSTVRHRLDHEAMEMHRGLLEHFRFVRPLRKKLSREDTGGWMRETFEICFEVADQKARMSTLSKDEAARLLEQRRSSLPGKLKALFRKSSEPEGFKNTAVMTPACPGQLSGLAGRQEGRVANETQAS